MPCNTLRIAALLLASPVLSAQMPHLPSLGASNPAQSLSDPQIASGLKEALSVGTQKAVKLVDKPGGYLENQEIKILLPSKLRPLEGTLRAAGQGAKLDDFVGSMNHAAEAAAPEAEGIFASAVREMSIDDARKLLSGGNHSITDYFRSKTSANLTSAFRPHAEKAMNANNVTQQYQALAGQLPSVRLLSLRPSTSTATWSGRRSTDYLLCWATRKSRFGLIQPLVPLLC